MSQFKYTKLDLQSNDGYLFKSILNTEYDKILNFYKHNKKFEDYKQFVANYFQPNSNIRSLLLYHGTGTGKTPTSILIINNIIRFSKNVNITIILPAALITTWKNELSNNIEEKYYINNKITFVTIDSPSFINNLDAQLNNLNANETNIIIMDECHLFFSRLLNDNVNTMMVYKQMLNIIHTRLNVYTILLSATPCVNDYEELMYLFNFLRPNLFSIDPSIIKNIFLGEGDDIKNQEYFLKRITGLVSYFEKDIEDSYPIIEDVDIEIPMSALQEKSYDIIEKKESMIKGSGSYMQKSIAACDFIVPEDNLLLYLNKTMDIKELIKNSSKEMVDNMSPKFKFAIKEFESTKRTCLFYFKNKDTALYPFEYILEYHYNYKRFDTKNLKNNKPFRTFASIHGDVDENSIKIIVDVFNSPENKYGELIKILNITKKFSVGVTIKYVEKFIINSHNWNSAAIVQIKGRVARATTHNILPKEERFVKIMTLISVRTNSTNLTANQKLKAISHKKDNYINKFLNLMKIGSIDLDYNRTYPSFKEKSLIPYNPSINFVLNPHPFITKNPINDIDLKLNESIININKIKTKKIKVITDINNKNYIEVILYIVGTNYLLYNIVYHSIIGKLELDDSNNPIISKNGYFLADLFI